MDKLSFMAIYPEIFLLVMASVILLVDVGSRSVLRPLAYYLSLFALAAVSVYYAVSLGAQISPAFLGANAELVQKFCNHLEPGGHDNHDLEPEVHLLPSAELQDPQRGHGHGDEASFDRCRLAHLLSRRI